MLATDVRMILIALMVLLAACGKQQQAAIEPASTAPGDQTKEPMAAVQEANGSMDAWMGRWPGVEGTYLDISRNGENYAIEIANLDGPRTYEGTAAGDHIQFSRGGKTESIRATDGKGTGMKWLLDKTHCLVVTAGSEGFCRD